MKLTPEQYALAKNAGIRAANHELALGEQILYTVIKFAEALANKHPENMRRVLEWCSPRVRG